MTSQKMLMMIAVSYFLMNLMTRRFYTHVLVLLPILGMDQILKLLLISRHLDTLSMTKHLTSLLLETLQVLVKELLVEKEQVLRKEGNQVWKVMMKKG